MIRLRATPAALFGVMLVSIGAGSEPKNFGDFSCRFNTPGQHFNVAVGDSNLAKLLLAYLLELEKSAPKSDALDKLALEPEHIIFFYRENLENYSYVVAYYESKRHCRISGRGTFVVDDDTHDRIVKVLGFYRDKDAAAAKELKDLGDLSCRIQRTGTDQFVVGISETARAKELLAYLLRIERASKKSDAMDRIEREPDYNLCYYRENDDKYTYAISYYESKRHCQIYFRNPAPYYVTFVVNDETHERIMRVLKHCADKRAVDTKGDRGKP